MYKRLQKKKKKYVEEEQKRGGKVEGEGGEGVNVGDAWDEWVEVKWERKKKGGGGVME